LVNGECSGNRKNKTRIFGGNDFDDARPSDSQRVFVGDLPFCQEFFRAFCPVLSVKDCRRRDRRAGDFSGTGE